MKDEDQHPDFNCTFKKISSLCKDFKRFRYGFKDVKNYRGEIAVEKSPDDSTWLGAIKKLLDS